MRRYNKHKHTFDRHLRLYSRRRLFIVTGQKIPSKCTFSLIFHGRQVMCAMFAFIWEKSLARRAHCASSPSSSSPCEQTLGKNGGYTHTHTQSWCEHGLNASQIFAQDNWSHTLGPAWQARDERGFVKICTPRRLLVRLLRRSSGRARFGGNFLFLLELLYLAGGPQQQRQGVSQTFIADASSHIVILFLGGLNNNMYTDLWYTPCQRRCIYAYFHLAT